MGYIVVLFRNHCLRAGLAESHAHLINYAGTLCRVWVMLMNFNPSKGLLFLCANDLLVFLPGLLLAIHTAWLVAYKDAMIEVDRARVFVSTAECLLAQWEADKYASKSSPVDNKVSKES